MRRGVWILLALSLAVNIGFLSAALLHWGRPGADLAGPGFGPGAGGHPDGGRPGWGPAGRRGRHRMGGPPAGIFDRWPGRRIERMDREVGLSPEQRQLLHDRLGELREAIRANAEELRDARQMLHRALRQGDLEAAQVRRDARRVAELQARMDSLVAEAIIRENAILNPEQRERYRDLEWGPIEEAGPPPVAP